LHAPAKTPKVARSIGDGNRVLEDFDVILRREMWGD